MWSNFQSIEFCRTFQPIWNLTKKFDRKFWSMPVPHPTFEYRLLSTIFFHRIFLLFRLSYFQMYHFWVDIKICDQFVNKLYSMYQIIFIIFTISTYWILWDTKKAVAIENSRSEFFFNNLSTKFWRILGCPNSIVLTNSFLVFPSATYAKYVRRIRGVTGLRTKFRCVFECWKSFHENSLMALLLTFRTGLSGIWFWLSLIFLLLAVRSWWTWLFSFERTAQITKDKATSKIVTKKWKNVQSFAQLFHVI